MTIQLEQFNTLFRRFCPTANQMTEGRFFVPGLKSRERDGQKFDSSDRRFFGLRLANSWPAGRLLDSTQPQTILSLVADCRFT